MTSDTENSDTDLHVAVRYGDLKQVREALKCRLSPNKIGLYQWSPLHEASSNGYSDIVRLLLRHGGNPNVADKLSANTSLHYAAQEGHPTCLRLLIEAGGDYSIANRDGDTSLDVATRACERVIEKKRVDELIRMPLKDAKYSAELDIQRIEHTTHTVSDLTSSPAGSTTSLGDKDPSLIIAPYDNPTVRAKAWAPQINKPDPGTLGMLHISFEYNSKKSYLKVRLWKLTGLLFSPTNSSMVSTLYVKSSLLPDVRHASKRKSEEIRLPSLYSKQRKSAQQYVTESGAEVTFEPITFKFTKPLVYDPISRETIEDKVIFIQVSLRQKYTQRTFKIADLTIPLHVAVTRIVKEAFPLRVCAQTKLPDSMLVLPDIKNHMATASVPNLRRLGTPVILSKSEARPASDVNLREVLSVSSHSPSVSVDIPSDDEPGEFSEDSLHREMIEKLPFTEYVDIVIPMPGSIEVPADEEGRMSSVRVDSMSDLTSTQTAESSVRVIVTNDDSDSGPDELTTSKTKSKISKLFGKHSTDKVIMLEKGEGQRLHEDGTQVHDSITDISEPSYNLTKCKLKPKVSTNPPAHTQFKIAAANSLRGSDVVLSLGDLELEEFEEPTRVHTVCKKRTQEDMV